MLAIFAASWILGSPPQPQAGELLTQFQAGPLKEVSEVVFAARQLNHGDGHWYANFGYYAEDANRKAWREGAKLLRLDLATGKATAILDDPRGGIRDPQMHYDGQKVLFSYRRGGTENYLLHEIDLDGSNLRQLTHGQFDDIEPTYLPNGDIVFVSSRCKRWVNCWLTQVAVLHRCDPDGRNVRALSSNNEHDNTPWPLPDGRLLYTRWEYVDRSQVNFHHLWSANPDGTGQMIFYGNLHPGITMIDAKPVPHSESIVASFSPGHGRIEHAGFVTLLNPKLGPDDPRAARSITSTADFRDPWALNEEAFLAARGTSLVLINCSGKIETLYELSAEDQSKGLECHEPRPVLPRPREKQIADRVSLDEPTGRLMLVNIYDGRNMAGIRRGEIKKLLVLETLPMPIHYTGGMDPVSYSGTFTLERIVGTVPVEPDGSAFLELPALRSFFFVALDSKDLAVKRMQSFLTVMPGEVTSCVGCHEQRTRTPEHAAALAAALAVRRPPSRIEPIPDVPEVVDYPRDVQPVLDQLCVDCHGYETTPRGGPRDGGLVLTGDRGPMFSHSYYALTVEGLFSDGRNRAQSNYLPRTLGSSASRLLSYLDGTHYDVQATAEQQRLLRLWIETGAAYPGTYAALGTGMIGGYSANQQVGTDTAWPTTQAGAQVLKAQCMPCHQKPSRLLPLSLSDERGVSFWEPDMNDPRLRTSRHNVFNLTRPELSLVLLAPLAKNAGGWELCRPENTETSEPVLRTRQDPAYQALLNMCRAGQAHLNEIKRFDMPDFTPRPEWVREMKRYGVLTADSSTETIDPYAIEQRYWQSLWHHPSVPE